MRPFGHDETRESRDAHTAPLDERLEEAWARYTRVIMNRMRRYNYVDEDSKFAHAKRHLSLAQPSVASLHDHIRRISPDDPMYPHLGMFVNAGYHLVPDRKIVYDLDTPAITSIGYGLFMKDLVITGATGNSTGSGMVGTLVNEGTMGDYAGRYMIGTFTNNGTLGEHPAYCMAGVFTHLGEGGRYPGEHLLGRLITRGQDRWTIKLRPLQECARIIIRKPLAWHKLQFLHDIANGEGRDHRDLHAYLFARYSDGSFWGDE